MDLASFDKQVLLKVHGEYPHCFLSPNLLASDWHHCVGRGNAKNDEDRKIHSSILNCIPLSRDIHSYCPLLTHPGMRSCLLNHAYKHVMNAVLARNYELNDIDKAFLEKYRDLY